VTKTRCRVLVLAVSSHLAISVDGLFASGCEVELSSGGSRWPDVAFRAVVGKFHPGVLHLFNYSKVLLDALLPGVGVAARLREATDDPWVRRWTRTLTIFSAAACLAAVGILIAVRHVPAPSDISAALSRHSKVYSLSLGHMEDLTLDSFAYLRAFLALVAAAFGIGALGTLRRRGTVSHLAAAAMMIVFFQSSKVPGLRSFASIRCFLPES